MADRFGPASSADHVAGPFFWLLLAGLHARARTPTGAACWAGVAVRRGGAQRQHRDSTATPTTSPSYLSSVCLIGLGPILFGQALRNRARLNHALRAKADARRARARRRGRRRGARASARGSRASCTTSSRTRSSAMTVQAGGRAAAGRARPATRAETRSRAVETTGREALTELRRLLGVLRREDEELALAPQPSLAHVDVARRAARARPACRSSCGSRASRAPLPGRRRPDGLPARSRRRCGDAQRAGGAAARDASAVALPARRACDIEVADDGGRDGRRAARPARAGRASTAASCTAGRAGRRRLARARPGCRWGRAREARCGRAIDPRVVDWVLRARVRRLRRSSSRRTRPTALVGPAWLTALVASQLGGLPRSSAARRPLAAIVRLGAPAS